MPEHFRFPGPTDDPARRPTEEGLGEWENDGEEPTPPVGSLAHFQKELAADAGRANALTQARERFEGAQIEQARDRAMRLRRLIQIINEEAPPSRVREYALAVQAEIGQVVDALISKDSSPLAAHVLSEIMSLPMLSDNHELATTVRALAHATAQALADKGMLLNGLLAESFSGNDMRPGLLSLVELMRQAMRNPDLVQQDRNKLWHLFERHRGELMTVWRENPMRYPDLVEPLMTVATESQQAQIQDFIQRTYSDNKETGNREWSTGAKVLGSSFASDYLAPQMMAKDILSRELERYGFSSAFYGAKEGVSSEKMFQAWRAAGNYAITPDQLVRTMRIVRELERERPGSTKLLFEQFGICDFGRYPLSILEEQYDHRENSSVPYGVILFPRADHNGAFYQDRKQLSELRESLGSSHMMRVVECDSKFDVFRRLRQLDVLYGGEQKISFAIVGGHGSPDSIQFGSEGKKADRLSIADLARVDTASARSFFVDKPTFILVSCSTGADDGIGTRLSREFGATVFAPKKPTNIVKMTASDSSQELRFEVEYKSTKGGEITSRFEKGVPAPPAARPKG